MALDNVCYSLQFDWDVYNASRICSVVRVTEPAPTSTPDAITPVPPAPTPTPGCSLDLREEATLMAWIHPDSFRGGRNSYGGVFHKGDHRNWSDEAYGMQFYRSRRLRIFFYYYDSHGHRRSNQVDASTRLEAGRWYHVAGTWNSSQIAIYIDGQLDNSRGNSYAARNTDGGLQIGAQLYNETSGSRRNYPFDGRIFDARIYNRALSSAEISSYYDSTK